MSLGPAVRIFDYEVYPEGFNTAGDRHCFQCGKLCLEREVIQVNFTCKWGRGNTTFDVDQSLPWSRVARSIYYAVGGMWLDVCEDCAITGAKSPLITQ